MAAILTARGLPKTASCSAKDMSAMEILLIILFRILRSTLLLAVTRHLMQRSRMALSKGWRALKYTRFCKAIRLTASRTLHVKDNPAFDSLKAD